MKSAAGRPSGQDVGPTSRPEGVNPGAGVSCSFSAISSEGGGSSGGPQYQSRCDPGHVPRAHTPRWTSLTIPEDASRRRIRSAASIWSPSHVWSVSTLSVTLGFWSTLVTMRWVIAARAFALRRSSTIARCLLREEGGKRDADFDVRNAGAHTDQAAGPLAFPLSGS